MRQIRRFTGILGLISVHRRLVFAALLAGMIVGATDVARAIVVVTGFFDQSGVNCEFCDAGTGQETATLGAPLQTLVGATWVQSPSNRLYAGGIRAGETVRFHLELNDIVTTSGATHFLVVFTTAVTGTKPGLLHVRDTSPGAKGEIKMIALPPTPPEGNDTQLIERVYRTPGADNALTGFGTGPSADPLPWDHPINRPVVDFALNMSGLDPKATWGLSTVLVGLHRLPCHCEPGAPQSLGNDCIPQNAQDIESATPQLFCPVTTSLNTNSCGKKRPTAWTCPAVQDTDPPRALPFTCTAGAITADGQVTTNCSSDEIDLGYQLIPASSCTYIAKSCP